MTAKSVATIGREMAAEIFAGSSTDAILITQERLTQLLAKAALSGFEVCAEDVKQMLTETGRGDPKCS